jgi:tripartite-type tricarboxylate transporter receptor subunit TctC
MSLARFARALALSIVGTALATAALAQVSYPTRPIRIIIPSTPGGGTDFIGRTLAQKLAESTGWTLVAENRPGAAGTLGLGEVVRAKPEGYDLVIGQTANVSLAPWLMKLSFDPVKDFEPVALAVEAPMVLLVNADSPYKTWADLVKAAKASPGKHLSYGTSGVGSVAQVAGEKVQEISGFKLDHVPYKGSAPAIADVLGGHLDLAGTSVASAMPQVAAGKVRALAITSQKRSASLPNVPTLAELGYPGFHIVEWYGVFAPAKLPPAIADKLNAEINKVLAMPDVKKLIVAQGQEPKPESRQAFAEMVKADNLASRDVIAKAGIKLE